MRILISGAGIAGPTLAYWLSKFGHEVTIVEKADKLRTGGYIVDFWGAGFEVAEKMNLLPKILERGYQVKEVRVVNEKGNRVSGFPASVFSRAARDRFTSLPRGDLAECVFCAIGGHVERIFGNTVTAIHQSGETVKVSFASGSKRTFDVVIGADGLHSRIRELVFGEESRFETYLGYKVAAFETEGYTRRDELVYVMYTQVAQQVADFRCETTVLFSCLHSPTTAPTFAGMSARKKVN